MGGSDCEALHGGWLAQPINAWSSVAYLVAAVYVLIRRLRTPATSPPMLVPGGVALAAVFVGSFAFHGPQPSWAGPAHDASIAALLLVVAAVVVAELRRRRRMPVPATAVVAFTLGVVCFVLGRSGGPLCSPASVVQLHAGWHILTAAAAGIALARPSPRVSRASRDRLAV